MQMSHDHASHTGIPDAHLTKKAKALKKTNYLMLFCEGCIETVTITSEEKPTD
jgi:hypothetical protein